MNKYIEQTADALVQSYADGIGVNLEVDNALPRRGDVLKVLEKLLHLVFPGFDESEDRTIKQLLYEINTELTDVADRAMYHICQKHQCQNCADARRGAEAVVTLLRSMCDIRQSMKLDVAAAYAGDPAASSYEEIIFSYPGIKAITIQRLAHILYQCKVPLIPRLMTEYAHSMTGIDIHPGASLGKGVFIDHGTGVVIGETAKIGDNVRIYQGVTLGALSFPKDACGILVKGAKRHPTVENDVVIYSGATILGDITIGEKCVIGGNVWLTEDLPAGTKIIANPPEHKLKYAHQVNECGKKCPKCI